MIKLLIFDLDGTLVDSIQDITDALNYAVAPLNIGPFSTAEIKEKVGSGITKLIEGLIPEEKSGMRDEIVKRFLEQYSAHLLDNTRAYPGVKETLSKLGDYRKAVISNKREALSKAVLDGLGLADFFDIILGSDSVPEKKPSPAPIIKILGDLGIDKDEALIAGDSNLDIEAGKKAGIKTVAVTYGYRGKEFLAGADYMIDNMSYLLTLLQKLNSREISAEVNIQDSRREPRYAVPEIYQKYISLKTRIGLRDFMPTVLLDFSRKGIKVKSPVAAEIDSTIDCVISAPKSLDREIAFRAKVRYCISEQGASDFLIGAAIVEGADNLWFNIFSKVHDFIIERGGDFF